MPPLGLPPPIPPHILERLMLSEEQQDKVFALLHAQAPRQRIAAKTAAATRDKLWHLVESGHYDAAQAQKLAAAHGQAVAALMLLQAEADAGLRALLTPEQRARLDREPTPRARPARPADPGH
jgi:Spy/CpxP family protein refolding chaperone